MRDFNTVINKSYAMLKDVGINVDNVFMILPMESSWYGMKKGEGVTKYIGDGKAVIQITSDTLDDDFPKEAMYETIIHELLHASVWGKYREKGHKGKWKECCHIFKQKYPWFKGDVYLDLQVDYGIEPDTKNYKYILKCEKCGYIYMRQHKCKFTMNPYPCIQCGGKIKLIETKENLHYE